MTDKPAPRFFVGVTPEGRFNISPFFAGHDVQPKIEIENISLDQAEQLGEALLYWSAQRRQAG